MTTETQRRKTSYQIHKENILAREVGRTLKRRRYRSEMLAIIKQEMGCRLCGYNKSAKALHFHHRDPTTKAGRLSKMLGNSIQTIQAEINKCDILCSNCHAEMH